MRVALLTCDELVDPDVDEAPLRAALAALGAEGVPVSWTSHPDLLDFDAAVLRSTWDYHLKVPAFRTFLEAAEQATRLVNPRAAVEATLHKRYLLALADRGIPVVPTRLISRGAPADPPAGPIVIKPAIGGGSWQTRRFDHPGQEAWAFLERSVAARDTLVQPVLAGFDDPGERSLVWIDGTFTHAIRKRPRYEGAEERVEALPELAPADLELARATVATLPPGCTFARVDVVDHDGQPVVTELEAIEPSLYLGLGPGSADRLAHALVRMGQG